MIGTAIEGNHLSDPFQLLFEYNDVSVIFVRLSIVNATSFTMSKHSPLLISKLNSFLIVNNDLARVSRSATPRSPPDHPKCNFMFVETRFHYI